MEEKLVLFKKIIYKIVKKYKFMLFKNTWITCE